MPEGRDLSTKPLHNPSASGRVQTQTQAIRYRQQAIQREAIEEWRRKQRDYGMPATPSAISAPLCERDGWSICTSGHTDKEANLLVHDKCHRAFPNWWLSPTILKLPENDSGITCDVCKEKLEYDAFKVFYGAYRLLNMTIKTKQYPDGTVK